MSPKFWFRTARNMVFRHRPYFAHLAFTHRCNLRCRFCHIPQQRLDEQDTEGMKRIIDKLDRMGIAILSISGGGEPLFRPDFAVLLNYAADKGLYTKITSNGTMPRPKYEELVNSRVDEIAISLDGVRGNDLPYSHVGPKILETLRFLNDHLPPRKLLTINVTISATNRDQVKEIVDYCTREFPRARIWLNPVVVGQGMLRVASELKVNPDYLRQVDSPTLLTPGFFKQACEEYYRSETFDWGCRAGELFFDIKPNGDFWICQDQPASAPLNILDPDFERKYAQADFSPRRNCGGCTYSCYYVTQCSFQPRTWPGMAGIWWKTTTRPDEPCRRTARQYGWVAGLLHLAAARFLLSTQAGLRPVLWAAVLAVLLGGSPAIGQSSSPLPSDPQEIVSRMEQCNEQRSQQLRGYRGQRRYSADNPRLRRKAWVLVEANFDAADGKQFRILERGGSGAVERRVFVPMLETEQVSSRPAGREATEISRRNYAFTFLGYDEAAGAYVFAVEPLSRNKNLLRGKVWVNAAEFAIQRIEGEPAQRPSFWVRRTHFIHEYARFGGFWLPVSNRTEVHLLLFGRSTMTIDYFDYEWQPRTEAACSAPPTALQSLPLSVVSRRDLLP
jgi:MoaA/NifB/PqqE/SkfB family radical SAM enzyme